MSQEMHYRNLAEKVHDIGDEWVACLLSDVNPAVIDHHLTEIAQMEKAALRLTAGTCARCAGCIDPDCLEAHPVALRRHRCHVRREQTRAQPGHAGL